MCAKIKNIYVYIYLHALIYFDLVQLCKKKYFLSNKFEEQIFTH